jgi:hypothetical protein
MTCKPIPQWLVNISIYVNEKTGGRKGWSLCARAYENRLNHFMTGCFSGTPSTAEKRGYPETDNIPDDPCDDWSHHNLEELEPKS